MRLMVLLNGDEANAFTLNKELRIAAAVLKAIARALQLENSLKCVVVGSTGLRFLRNLTEGPPTRRKSGHDFTLAGKTVGLPRARLVLCGCNPYLLRRHRSVLSGESMTLFNKFPENRYTALDEIQELLKFRKLDLLTFLETLARADDAFLRYTFGNLSVTFIVNDGLCGCVHASDEDEEEAACAARSGPTVITISLDLEKDDMETSATYQFTLDELHRLCRAKPLAIERLGGS